MDLSGPDAPHPDLDAEKDTLRALTGSLRVTVKARRYLAILRETTKDAPQQLPEKTLYSCAFLASEQCVSSPLFLFPPQTHPCLQMRSPRYAPPC